MDEVKLALELNRVVHNECKDVPHDMGLRLLEVVKKHIGEQLNLPPVSKPLPTRTINTKCNKCKSFEEHYLTCTECGNVC